MIATSAGAPMLSVPRSSNDGKQRAALTVAQAMIWLSGMPNMMNFDITLGRSTTPLVFDGRVPVGGERIGPQALPGRLLDRVPIEMIGDAVAEIEDDATAARRQHIRQQHALVVEDAVHSRRIHVGDDVAALEQRQNGAHAASKFWPT